MFVLEYSLGSCKLVILLIIFSSLLARKKKWACHDFSNTWAAVVKSILLDI